MAKLGLEVVTDVLLMETGDALLLERVWLHKLLGVTNANIAKINGIAMASIGKVNGFA